MSSQIFHYKKTADLRIRPVHEMEICLIFTPSNPQLFTLNSTVWLIFELCEGRSLDDLESAYYDIVEPLLSREDVHREVTSGIAQLESSGLIERVFETPVNHLAN